MLSPARTAAQMRGAVPVASPRPAMTLTAPQARVSMRASEVSIGGRPVEAARAPIQQRRGPFESLRVTGGPGHGVDAVQDEGGGEHRAGEGTKQIHAFILALHGSQGQYSQG